MSKLEGFSFEDIVKAIGRLKKDDQAEDAPSNESDDDTSNTKKLSHEEIEALKNLSDDLQKIENVEIFRVGVWNGDKYTRKDLDDMVEAFKGVGFRPPIKLGHAEKPGGPAFGWIENIHRIGDRLIANFMDVPSKLVDAIKSRAFDTVSAEIFWDLSRNGKKFRRVLKAVALLGAETPGVSNLAPLRTVVNSIPESEFDQLYAYAHRPEEWNMDKIETLTTEITELTQKLAEAEEARVSAEAEAEKAKDTKEADEFTVKPKDSEEAKAAIEAALVKVNEQLVTVTKEKDEKVANLEAEVKRLSEEAAVAKEEKRLDKIKQKVGECKLPVVRKHIEALYDVATKSETVVKFTQDDKEADLKAEEVVDALVETLNGYTAKLFKELGTANTEERLDDVVDPSVEIDKLARKYAADNKVEYGDAIEAVLTENPKLRAAYGNKSVH